MSDPYDWAGDELSPKQPAKPLRSQHITWPEVDKRQHPAKAQADQAPPKAQLWPWSHAYGLSGEPLFGVHEALRIDLRESVGEGLL